MAIAHTSCPSGDEKVKLFGLLLETNARLAKELGQRLESTLALPLPWFEVLLALRNNPDRQLKMSEVADAIVHSTPGTTRLIDRMEEVGYVERVHCPNDRRAIYVVLSRKGDVALDQALAVHIDFLDEHLGSVLSATERSALSTLLLKVNGR